jgi:hypothetical protein
VEKLNQNPEAGSSGSSSDDFSRFGRLVDIQLEVDMEAMFDKANYPTFLAQTAAEEMGSWTGVPLTIDDPIGEFAAAVYRDGRMDSINLAFAGKFSSMWGKSDLLLIANNDDDRQRLCKDYEINEDYKVLFLVSVVNPTQPSSCKVAPFMAIMEPWYLVETDVPMVTIGYTMLSHAYLRTLS